MNLFVLSPHRDDAAFSLSLSIANWLALGHSVTIVNCFTRSLYAPCAELPEGSEAAQIEFVTALRESEDQSFVSAVGTVAMIDLGMADAPIRLHCESSQVCDILVDAHDAAMSTICTAVAELTRNQPANSAIVLPLGLGHHVDHCTARDAAMPLSTKLPCAFYEDLPYAMRNGVEEDLSRLRETEATFFHERLYPVLCRSTETRPTEFKKRLALLYKSQIDRQLADSIADFSYRYGGAERLWANEAWVSLSVSQKLSSMQFGERVESIPA